MSEGQPDQNLPEPDRETMHAAMIIAMVVRNTLESFHNEHLTNEQMRELNPLVRNAIVTALYALKSYGNDERCTTYIEFQRRLIPEYWEVPRLLEDFLSLWKLDDDQVGKILPYVDGGMQSPQPADGEPNGKAGG